MKKDKVSESLVYESLNIVARNFEEILKELERLQQLRWFRRRSPIKTLELALQETHAWTMFEILEVLHERAESDGPATAACAARRKTSRPGKNGQCQNNAVGANKSAI